MKILIVDNEEANVLLLKGILQRAGYTQLTAIHDSRKAVELYKTFQPDLMLVDFHMPHLNGFGVMEALAAVVPKSVYFPILMLTADVRPEVRQKALASGAKDFLSKPLNAEEVRLRIRNLLETRRFYLQLQEQNASLEAQVQERTRQLEETQIEMLVRLAKAAEFRDDDSDEHVWRVSRTSWLLAQELGMAEDRAELLLRASRLHDMGKIGIPDGILLKPGRLSAPEYEVVKAHTTIGAQLLSGGRSPLMKMAETIAQTHHERWDGTGYPCGLQGDEIPLESRILAVADTFDAITHDRIHRRARTVSEAADEIRSCHGLQFDPEVVEAFLKLYERGDLVASVEGVRLRSRPKYRALC